MVTDVFEWRPDVGLKGALSLRLRSGQALARNARMGHAQWEWCTQRSLSSITSFIAIAASPGPSDSASVFWGELMVLFLLFRAAPQREFLMHLHAVERFQSGMP